MSTNDDHVISRQKITSQDRFLSVVYLSRSLTAPSHCKGTSDAIRDSFGNGVVSLSSVLKDLIELEELGVRLVAAAESSLTVAIPVERGTMGVGAASPSGFGMAVSTNNAWTDPTDSTKITTGLLLELTSLSSLEAEASAEEASPPSDFAIVSKKDRLVGPEASVAIVPKSCPVAIPRIVIEEDAGRSTPRMPLSVTKSDSPWLLSGIMTWSSKVARVGTGSVDGSVHVGRIRIAYGSKKDACQSVFCQNAKSIKKHVHTNRMTRRTK